MTVDRAVSELLVRHPDIDKVTFTGATAVGKRIAATCAERVARFRLQLGGKSGAVILDDSDLEQTSESISQSAGPLTGRVCSSLTRLIRRAGRITCAGLNLKVGVVRCIGSIAPKSYVFAGRNLAIYLRW